jgi:hypothetical protein
MKEFSTNAQTRIVSWVYDGDTITEFDERRRDGYTCQPSPSDDDVKLIGLRHGFSR